MMPEHGPGTGTGSSGTRDAPLRHATRARHGHAAWLAALAAIGLATALPAAARLLNIVRIDGLPLGFHACAQGGIVLLAALMMGFAARSRRREASIDSDREDRT